jgi:isopentenyl diphosphate isomerase/L-lactate dehydrogenase-like FMN-dependent dehydrogenase
MKNAWHKAENRRRFLRLLATSPLLAYAGRAFSTDHFAQDLIVAPEEALNVLEFEAVARQNLPPAHFGYLATGVTDDATLRANREGFGKYQLRVRRLRDVQKIDLSVRLFGTTWDNPIILAPVGSQKAFHPAGEIAVAKAARAKGHHKILSTHASSSVETVNEALGAPTWFQLYPTDDWNVTRALVKRAEAAGCPVLVLTVDSLGGSLRETYGKLRRTDTRQCMDCHLGGFTYNAMVRRRPMFQGVDVSQVRVQWPLNLTWDIVKRLKDLTLMKLILKGIVTREDAELAVAHGADGIIVSNHGGRAEDSRRSTIECLAEVVAAVQGRIPVLIDGGFRRGTDIFKALALGAQAVCIGRPYLWGLAAFGQPGVETVLTLLRRELTIDMRQAGTASIAQITREYLIER